MITREYARRCLQVGTGCSDVDFRPGQWEAIDGVLNHRRQLVLQRTGWGKSMIYFLASKFLRQEGRGMTLLISPLLALMRNQVAAANKVGVKCYTINSNCSKAEKDQVKSLVLANQVDLLIVSPERLADDSFQTDVLEKISDSIGLLVVDEAHCISDWGHAFRPDYKKISRLLARLPANVPVLATTATANGRVVEDVKTQLGGTVDVSRGSLVRDSLYLQNIRLDRQEDRLAWLAETLPKLEGTGVVYALTVRDADRVARWLRACGISAYAYSGSCTPPPDMDAAFRSELEQDPKYVAAKASEKEDDISAAYRVFLEDALLTNRIKALVATSALSMGFDKPDMKFVIHYQRPKSVVDYYQQVGRAGRGVASACGILLNGAEDNEIAEYFIESAFPSEDVVNLVLKTLLSGDGMSRNDLQKALNLKWSKIEQVLKFVMSEVPQPIVKNGTKYCATPAAVNYKVPVDRIARFTTQLRQELAHMDEYVRSDGCLMDFLCQELESPMETPACGHCQHCDPDARIGLGGQSSLIQRAADFLRKSHVPIKPRAKWMDKEAIQNVFEVGKYLAIPEPLRMESGLALTSYGSGEWGRLVIDGKYRARPSCFDERLVTACVEMYENWKPAKNPSWVTCVPSLRHPELVPRFAQRFAAAVGLPFVPCVVKLHETEEQKKQANSFMQQNNLISVFGLTGNVPTGDCLLIDDMVDSRWTLTIVAAILRQAGVSSVTPMVLADSSNAGE